MNHGFLMVVYSLLWLSLVLGGVAGSLCFWEALRGTWLGMARVPAPVRRPVWQWDDGGVLTLLSDGDRFWPLPGDVVARAGPRSRPPAS
jgi:hypothetical protein